MNPSRRRSPHKRTDRHARPGFSAVLAASPDASGGILPNPRRASRSLDQGRWRHCTVLLLPRTARWLAAAWRFALTGSPQSWLLLQKVAGRWLNARCSLCFVAARAYGWGGETDGTPLPF